MTELQRTSLPGVGVRYDYETRNGQRVAVVHHRRGRRELYVMTEDDPEAVEAVVDLDDEDSRTVAEMLGGSRVVEQLADLQQQIEGLALDWLTLGDDSPYAGRKLGDARIRTRTGASVVAVIRGSSAHPSPGPEFSLERGDTMVVVGTPEGLEATESILEMG